MFLLRIIRYYIVIYKAYPCRYTIHIFFAGFNKKSVKVFIVHLSFCNICRYVIKISVKKVFSKCIGNVKVFDCLI